MFALFNHGGAALAQQGAKDVTVEAIPIEKVLNANPEPDGKVYRIDLLLSEGKRVAYTIPPSEAAKIADGLSKPAIAGGQNRQIATIISGMTIETDSEGKAVILTDPIECDGASCNPDKWRKPSRTGPEKKDCPSEAYCC